jgi:hypothetical protein
LDRNDPKFRRGAEGEAFAAIRSWAEEGSMIYEVTLQAPAINEVVTTSADSEEQAIERAVASAVQRMLAAGTATTKVVAIPDATA